MLVSPSCRLLRFWRVHPEPCIDLITLSNAPQRAMLPRCRSIWPCPNPLSPCPTVGNRWAVLPSGPCASPPARSQSWNCFVATGRAASAPVWPGWCFCRWSGGCRLLPRKRTTDSQGWSRFSGTCQLGAADRTHHLADAPSPAVRGFQRRLDVARSWKLRVLDPLTLGPLNLGPNPSMSVRLRPRPVALRRAQSGQSSNGLNRAQKSSA